MTDSAGNYVLFEVTQTDRLLAAKHAERRGMAQSTIRRYLSGAADKEVLLQTIAEARHNASRTANNIDTSDLNDIVKVVLDLKDIVKKLRFISPKKKAEKTSILNKIDGFLFKIYRK